jgi:tRNA threonylcarbamoyladenosine modification (KEOPS) complex Cgi121 subunit
MIEKLEDFDQYLVIAGFKNVQINNADAFFKDIREKTHNACVQFFDAILIAGPEHLRFAALNALNALKNKLNISSSLTMETLLYASAQNQINNAINQLGIKPGSRQVAVLIMAESKDKASRILDTVSKLLPGKRDDSVIELSSTKVDGLKKLFRISSLELEAKTERKGTEKEAVLDLVIEHMALLATER